MGKSRLYGNKATIYVVNPVDNTEIKVGEVEHFNAKSLDELKTYRSLGETEYGSQTEFKGWELSFDGPKVDWKLAALMHAQDEMIASGERSPYFKVKQNTKNFGAKNEGYWYHDVTVHGYEYDAPNEDALNEKFMGFSGKPRTVDDATHTDVTASHTGSKTLLDAIKAKMVEDGRV